MDTTTRVTHTFPTWGTFRRHTSRVRAMLLAFGVAALVAIPQCVAAEDTAPDRERTSPVVAVLTDPTTYAPASLLYTSMRLDWISSQPFFSHGFVEENARYTINGRKNSRPLSYGDGNQKILLDTVKVLPASMVNNLVTQMIERRLSERFPGKRKLWTTLSWVERISFATFASYRLSAPHFKQWQKNERLAREYGFVQP